MQTSPRYDNPFHISNGNKNNKNGKSNINKEYEKSNFSMSEQQLKLFRAKANL